MNTNTARSTVFLILVIFSTAISPLSGQGPKAPLVPACGVVSDYSIPPDFASLEAPRSTSIPFVANPANVGLDLFGRTARFQQWISPSALPPLARLHRLRYRLDGATPAASFEGDLSFAVEVSLAYGPKTSSELTLLADENLRSKPVPAFDGVVTVEGSFDDDPTEGKIVFDNIDIVFEEPFLYDASQGPLLIDMRIRGSFGTLLPFRFDAVSAADTDVTAAIYLATDPTVARFVQRPNAPVVSIQASSIESSFDSFPECLAMLPIDIATAAAIQDRLLTLDETFRQDSILLGQGVANELGLFIDDLQKDGAIDPLTAAVLQQLAAQHTFAKVGSLVAFGQIHEYGIRNEFGVGLYNYERIMVPFLPDDDVGIELRQHAVEVQDQVRDTLNFTSIPPGFCDQHQQMIMAMCNYIAGLVASGQIDADTLQVAVDLKELVLDKNDLIAALSSLIGIIDDLRLEHNDLSDLKILKSTLKRMAGRTSSNGVVRNTTEHIIRILCGLAAHLDSGDLVSVDIDVIDGKLVMTIDVEDEIEIRIAEFIDLDTNTAYGKTNIYIDVHVKQDSTVSFCNEGLDDHGKEKASINFNPRDGIDLDFDSSGIFLVDYIEQRLGEINLDKLCLHQIRFENCQIIICGESSGKSVKVTMDADAVDATDESSGLTIEVDGMQVLPQ